MMTLLYTPGFALSRKAGLLDDALSYTRRGEQRHRAASTADDSWVSKGLIRGSAHASVEYTVSLVIAGTMREIGGQSVTFEVFECGRMRASQAELG